MPPILGCCNSGSGGGGGNNPPAIGVNGAVDIERPANTITRARARMSDIDPSFSIASFSVDLDALNPGGTPGLYERGQTIPVSGLTQAALSYVSGAPTSLSVANSYGGSADGGDVALGAWASVAPFAVASCTGSVKRSGTDGAADPTLTVTANAVQDGVPSSAQALFTWTGKIGHGLGNVGGGEVIDQAFVLAMLSTLAQGPAETFTVSPSDQTVYQCIPSQYYNAGTYAWTKGGFAVPVEVKAVLPITNPFGVTRSYHVLGTVFRITQVGAVYVVTA